MEYRRLGRTNLNVGFIGLGTEHLAQTSENMREVLAACVDAGINYIDVLYIDVRGSDADFWNTIGPALEPYRDKLILTVHWGAGNRYEVPFCEECFKQILSRIPGGYADIVMLTMVDQPELWDGWGKDSVRVLQRYQRNGQIGYIGMSSHIPSTILPAVKSGLIDVVMCAINLGVHDDPGTRQVIETCQQHDVGLVAMKPYSAGHLLNRRDGQSSGISTSQCLAYIASESIATAVPGARNVSELRETLAYLDAPPKARDYEQALYDMPQGLQGECLQCRHCLPCPEEIDIPSMTMVHDFVYTNPATVSPPEETAAQFADFYSSLVPAASDCTTCGICEERCPFNVDIINKMRDLAHLFDN